MEVPHPEALATGEPRSVHSLRMRSFLTVYEFPRISPVASQWAQSAPSSATDFPS